MAAGAIAAIAPLVISGVEALLPEIPTIVKAVEGLFGSGTGDVKLPTAVGMAQTAATALSTAGKIQGVPDVTTLTTLVETIVQQMNAAGQLSKAPAASSGTAGTPAASPKAAGVAGAGTTLKISGTLQLDQGA